MKQIFLFWSLLSPLYSFGQEAILDTKFANIGKLTLSYPWKEGTVEKIDFDTPDKAVLIGFPTKNLDTQIGVCSINLTDLKDSTRAIKTKILNLERLYGQSLTEIAPLRRYSAIFRIKNHQFITAGSEKINGLNGVSLYRYDDSGALNKSFGKNGLSFVSFDQNTTTREIIVTDILVGRNNRIYITLFYSSDPKQAYFFIYNSDGQLDKRILIDIIEEKTFVPYRLIENNNGIVVIGTNYTLGDSHQSYLVKYSYEGKKDLSFGVKGVVNLSKKLKGDILPNSITSDMDKHILIANSVYKKDENPGIIRLTKDGDLDKTFFRKGYIRLTTIPLYFNTPKISIDTNNLIYLLFSGYNFNTHNTELLLTRLANH